MKRIIAIITIALASMTSTRADLIDLTPGGFSLLSPPQVYIDWVNGVFGPAYGIAYETQSGWDPFHLGPPLFTSTPLGGTTADLFWNLTGTPYSIAWVFVGTGPNGWINMYQVSADQIIAGNGTITINGLYDITGIGIYGPVALETPDGGSTVLMFGLAVACIAWMRFWRQTACCGGNP